jgi:hypothetical protein
MLLSGCMWPTLGPLYVHLLWSHKACTSACSFSLNHISLWTSAGSDSSWAQFWGNVMERLDQAGEASHAYLVDNKDHNVLLYRSKPVEGLSECHCVTVTVEWLARSE